MKTFSRIFAGAALLLAASAAARAVDTDPGYGSAMRAQWRAGSGSPNAALYRPTKRYFTKNGAILYDFVPATRVSSRNVALGHEAWLFSKTQQWHLERGVSPRVVLTTVPIYAPKPPPIAEGPRMRP